MKQYRTQDGQVFPSFVDALLHVRKELEPTIEGPDWTMIKEGGRWFQKYPNGTRYDQTYRVDLLFKENRGRQ